MKRSTTTAPAHKTFRTVYLRSLVGSKDVVKVRVGCEKLAVSAPLQGVCTSFVHTYARLFLCKKKTQKMPSFEISPVSLITLNLRMSRNPFLEFDDFLFVDYRGIYLTTKCRRRTGSLFQALGG